MLKFKLNILSKDKNKTFSNSPKVLENDWLSFIFINNFGGLTLEFGQQTKVLFLDI